MESYPFTLTLTPFIYIPFTVTLTPNALTFLLFTSGKGEGEGEGEVGGK
jgi:hypothetical protein